MLLNDIALVAMQLDTAEPWWRTLPAPQQRVLINLGFNMGVPTLSTFGTFLGMLLLPFLPLDGIPFILQPASFRKLGVTFLAKFFRLDPVLRVDPVLLGLPLGVLFPAFGVDLRLSDL